MGNADTDFVVVGSGPNGLVAACVLARYGHLEHWSESGAGRRALALLMAHAAPISGGSGG